MKKLLLIVTLVFSIFMLSACQSGTEETADKPEDIVGIEDAVMIQDDLSLIMDEILSGTNAPEGETQEIPADAFEYYFGIEPIEGAEAIANEPVGGSEPHSVCLLRLPEDVDVNAVAADIQANADPNKWIYVEAETVLVETNENVVLLAMSSAEVANAVVSNFNELPTK